ncbi:MAG: O-antigen ligase family protein [Helicobacteraceae bacterium]|jgi:O-antigen ligase|nr:O-antigen ligase family protein [Helicobacteraceae bacterium]
MASVANIFNLDFNRALLKRGGGGGELKLLDFVFSQKERIIFAFIVLTAVFAILNHRISTSAGTVAFVLLLALYAKRLKSVYCNPIGVACLLYVGYIGLAILWSDNYYSGWREFRFSIPWLILPLLILYFNESKPFDKWTLIAVLAGFQLAVLATFFMRLGIIEPYKIAAGLDTGANMQYFPGLHYGRLAPLIEISALIALFLSARAFINKRKLACAYCVGWFVLSVIVMFALPSRTTYVSFTCAFFASCALIFFQTLNVRFAYKILYSALGAIVLTASIVVLAYNLSSSVERRLENTNDDMETMINNNYRGSIGARVAMWRLGIAVLSKRPFFGAGTGAQKNLGDVLYEERKDLIYPLDPIVGEDRKMSVHLHNQFVETLARHGIVGMTLLLAMFFAIIREAFAVGAFAKMFCGALLIELLIQSIPGSTLVDFSRIITFVLLFACVITIKPQWKDQK